MRLSIIPIILLLVSSLPSTVLELKSEATEKKFRVENSYQAAYRDLNQFLDQCISGGFMLAINNIQGNVYSELGEANLTVRNNNMGDKSVMLHIELRAIEDKQK